MTDFHRTLGRIALLAAVASASLAHAQQASEIERIVAIEWEITESVGSMTEQTLREEQPTLLAKVLPVGRIQATREIRLNSRGNKLPQGVFLAPASQSTNVICETERRRGQGSMICLADSDRDGSYDQYATIDGSVSTYSENVQFGYTIGRFQTSRWRALEAPVDGQAFQAAEDMPSVDITLNLEVISLYGEVFLSVCALRSEGNNIWGAAKNGKYCYDSARVPFSEIPRETTLGLGWAQVHSVERKTDSAVISYFVPGTGTRI